MSCAIRKLKKKLNHEVKDQWKTILNLFSKDKEDNAVYLKREENSNSQILYDKDCRSGSVETCITTNHC